MCFPLQPWSSASVSVSVMDSAICSGLAPEPASPVTTFLPFSPVTHKITQIHHTCTWASAQASPPPGWVAAAFILPHLSRSPFSLHKISALQEPQTVLFPHPQSLSCPQWFYFSVHCHLLCGFSQGDEHMSVYSFQRGYQWQIGPTISSKSTSVTQWFKLAYMRTGNSEGTTPSLLSSEERIDKNCLQ